MAASYLTARHGEALVEEAITELADAAVGPGAVATPARTVDLFGPPRRTLVLTATRLEQEIVLGVGGMRALCALGLEPSVWHINEGHAAFLVLERMRALVAGGLAVDEAIEAVAANTVFTTHTPVPAGHDQFSDAVVVPYLKSLFGELGSPETVAALALMGMVLVLVGAWLTSRPE